MGAILDVMKAAKLNCLPCERLSLDTVRFTEYTDSVEHSTDILFENPPLGETKVRVRDLADSDPGILRFFLDGSRKVYKIADLVKDGRYLPIIAGQVGVAVVRKEPDQSIVPLRNYCAFENVIVIPDRVGKDDRRYLDEQLKQRVETRFTLLKYTLKSDKDPVDLAVGQVMTEMQRMEIDTVDRMVADQLVANDSLLVVDGPLQFGREIVEEHFRNVVGISKTFRPSFTLGKGRGRKDAGSIAASLGFGYRTSAYRTPFKFRSSIRMIGTWYMRLRPPGAMANPLQGVVKMEVLADADEVESGLDSERVEVISANVLRERNVCPFGWDSRWASHLYPVYMAEMYLKSSFMSDTQFKGLF